MKKDKRILAMLIVVMLSLTFNTSAGTTEAQADAIQAYTLPQEVLIKGVTDTVRHARTSYTSFYNIGYVPRGALRKAASTALESGGKVFVNFDTLTGEEVTARITVNPLLVKSDEGSICFIVDTTAKTNEKVKEKFEKLFEKPVAVMYCGQKEDFGMPVMISGKLDLSRLNKEKLIAYSYYPDKNEYAEIENAKCTADDKGFVYLQSRKGGYIVITVKD